MASIPPPPPLLISHHPTPSPDRQTNPASQNVSYNAALRQSKAIRTQLTSLPPDAAPTPSDIGNIAASLASFSKSIDEYARHSQHEPVAKKQAESVDRLARFRSDLSEFRTSLESVKRARDEAQHQENRAELLHGNRRPYGASATPENPYSDAHMRSKPSPYAAASGYGMTRPWRTDNNNNNNNGLGFGTEDEQRESHALREQQFFASTHSALDDYLARGQAVLNNLGEQREIMKGTQRRLYSVANTLGVSGDTIRMVERRAREDRWIFGGGVLVFFVFCWLCLRYLR